MVGTPILTTTLRQSTWHHHLSILTFHNIEQLFTPVTNNNRHRTRRCTCTAQSVENPKQCSTSSNHHQKREPSATSAIHIRKPLTNPVFSDKPANSKPIVGNKGQRLPPTSSPTVDLVLDPDPLLSVPFLLEPELQLKFQEGIIPSEGLRSDSIIDARVSVDKDRFIAVVKGGEEGVSRGEVSVCNEDETLIESSGRLKERDREAVGGGRRKLQALPRKGMEKERGYRSKRGMEALTAFLRRPEHSDFRSFDLAQFVSWLENVVAQRMSNDRIFQQRDRISGIIREHLEEHTTLQGALDAAREEYSRAPTSITLRQMEQDLLRCRAATSGLRQFLAGAPSSSPSPPDDPKQSPGSAEPLSSGPAEPGFGEKVEGGGGGGGEMSQEDLEVEMETNARDAAQAGRLLRLLLREVSSQGGEGGEAATEGRGIEEERNLKKVKAAERKLVRLELMLPEIERTYERLCQSTPEWRALREAEVALDAFDRRVGVTELRGGLQALGKQRGQSTLSSGRNFEDVCTSLLEDMLPSLARSLPKPPTRSLEILSNVTLGMAMGEIDKMVVVPSEIPGGECEVVALLECKQNVNDLGPSFSNYQAFLGWLTRDEESYVPSAWTTKKYPKGHFDRAATHAEGQRTYSIGPSSFRHFQRSPSSGHFLHSLMFAVNATHGGTLTGLDSRALNAIASKIAGDVSFRPGLESRDEGYLTALLEWAKRSYRSPYSTADVLRFYTESDETAEHILFVDIENGGGR